MAVNYGLSDDEVAPRLRAHLPVAPADITDRRRLRRVRCVSDASVVTSRRVITAATTPTATVR